jgi:predicted RNA-binding Zn-ribbon protein involved in translation (DUF1610 family)
MMVKCPNCGFQQEDWWWQFNPTLGNYTCPACGHKFRKRSVI